MTSPRRSTLAEVGTTLAILLAGTAGVVAAWFDVGLQFFGEQADRNDYLVAGQHLWAAAVGVGVLGTFVVLALRRSPWQLLVVAATSAGLAAYAVHHRTLAASVEANGYPPPDWSDAALPAVVPTAWPLLVLSIVAAVGLVVRLMSTGEVRHEKVGP